MAIVGAVVKPSASSFPPTDAPARDSTAHAGAARLRFLDLCAGLGGWSAPIRERGHDATSLDLEPRFGCDFTRDVLEVSDLAELERGRGRFDVVLASPPCEKFSVMTIARNWRTVGGAVEPTNEAAVLALRIARHIFALVDAYRPRFFVIENPRGMLRRLAPSRPTTTTWYCQWGMPYAKPTDLWTNIVGEWPRCRPGASDHVAQPRGFAAKVAAGTIGLGISSGPRDREAIRDALVRGERVPGWGLRAGGALRRRTAIEMHTSGGGRDGAATRSLIPYALARAVMRACENGGRLDDAEYRTRLFA